jgi:hypothetical protein
MRTAAALLLEGALEVPGETDVVASAPPAGLDTGAVRFSAIGNMMMIATRPATIVAHAHSGGSLHQ